MERCFPFGISVAINFFEQSLLLGKAVLTQRLLTIQHLATALCCTDQKEFDRTFLRRVSGLLHEPPHLILKIAIGEGTYY